MRNSVDAIAALFLPSAISTQHVALARREVVDRRGPPAEPPGDQDVDDQRIDHRTATGDCVDGRAQLVDVLQALLQEVGAPVRSSVEEPQGVLRLGVLAQHDHADVRVEVAQGVGGPQPLVDSARRHADVRHDDVGPLALDGGQERIEIAACRDDLDVGLEARAAAALPPARAGCPPR